jgi:hypothetical protein
MLILNRFIYKLFYEKEKNLQDIIVVEMYELVNIQCIFNQITWCICVCVCVYILEKSTRMKCIFFIWIKYEKKNND